MNSTTLFGMALGLFDQRMFHIDLICQLLLKQFSVRQLLGFRSHFSPTNLQEIMPLLSHFLQIHTTEIAYLLHIINGLCIIQDRLRRLNHPLKRDIGSAPP